MKQSFNKESRRSCMRPTLLLPTILILITGFTGCGLFGGKVPDDLLTVTPVSAVEAMLEIHAERGDNTTIHRDGDEIFSFRMNRPDTLLTDTGLQPTTSYLWKASNGNGSKTRQVTTLDTTSSNFTWQKFEFGEYSSSSIKDVAIIDENNIWAVGEIYMNDSTGTPEVTPYNVVHWNGEEWKTIRLKYNCRLYFPNCGPVTDLYDEATSIVAFGANDIWITAGTVHHFDGNSWTQFAGIQGVGSSNASWGSSSDNVWFGGYNGFLAHYNGETWQQLESGTSLNINDIWGSKNPRTSKWEVLAVASEPWVTTEERLLSISGTTVNILPTNESDLIMNAIWFEAGRRYFIGGNELFQAFSKEGDWSEDQNFQPGFPSAKQAVSGNGLNDIVVVGTYGLVMHFNGAGWRLYEDQQLLPAGAYTSLDIKGNIVVAGGGHEGKGIVLVGRRE